MARVHAYHGFYISSFRILLPKIEPKHIFFLMQAILRGFSFMIKMVARFNSYGYLLLVNLRIPREDKYFEKEN